MGIEVSRRREISVLLEEVKVIRKILVKVI